MLITLTVDVGNIDEPLVNSNAVSGRRLDLIQADEHAVELGPPPPERDKSRIPDRPYRIGPDLKLSAMTIPESDHTSLNYVIHSERPTPQKKRFRARHCLIREQPLLM